MTSAGIDNLVYEWGRKFVLGTILVETMKIGANPNSALFYVDRNWV
jgi:hypothetical protein